MNTRKHPLNRFYRSTVLVVLLAMLLPALGAATSVLAQAQSTQPPLDEEQILVVGLELRPTPEHQVVPKNQGTSVRAVLGTLGAGGLQGELPTLPADAVVMAELHGPAFGAPIPLAALPGGNFQIPPLPLAGLYTLQNIRLVNDGQVVLEGNPNAARIEVIERVLVSQVTSRPLTAQEIQNLGIVIDQSNYQAVNFTVAFGLQNETVQINLPMLLPGAGQAGLPGLPILPIADLGAVSIPEEGLLPDLSVRMQAPNISISGFSLEIEDPEERKLRGLAAPIPGVVIIPGNVAYLNQFFSVILKVSNVAPGYSNLEVKDLKATIVLPTGDDKVIDSLDDPLRMAKLGDPPAPQAKEQPVVYAGPDGQLKTGDDVNALAPQQSGDAEYLVEGVREGIHTVEMEITGMLHGLPDGPVAVKGRALGVVEVRNPTFALTINHPQTVSAGEEYDLLVTIANVSSSPANFVSLNLLPRSISGAELLSDPSSQVETIPPGDAATVTFRLRSLKTGTVTATSIAADGIPGKFELRTAVGELGIPMSPTSLVLPAAANNLPQDLRMAAIALLNQAFALASSPLTPPGLLPLGRNVVYEYGVSLAATGQRMDMGEPLGAASRDLMLDFMGNNFSRLPDRYSGARLNIAERDYKGFDQLLRRSKRGAALRDVVAAVWDDAIAASAPLAFQQDFAEAVASRPAHLSVILAGDGAAKTLNVSDPGGRKLGVVQVGDPAAHDIPFGGFFSGAGWQNALIAHPDAGEWQASVLAAANGAFDLGLIIPDGAGLRRVAFQDVSLQQGGRARVRFTVGSAVGSAGAVELEIDGDGDGVFETAAAPTLDEPIVDRAPGVISAFQILTGKKDGTKYGQVVGVLFSEEVTPASVQDDAEPEDITNYAVEANQVRNVQIQADHRVVLMFLRDGVGPYVQRTMTVSNAVDMAGNVMQPLAQTQPIQTKSKGARLSGVVRRADGSPVPFAMIALSQIETDINDEKYWETVSVKSTDAEGRYSFDLVLLRQLKVKALDTESNEQNFAGVNPRFEGQHIQMDVILMGVGAVAGRAVAADGVTPLAGAQVKVSSLSQFDDYGTPVQALAVTGADGSFRIGGVPVGPLSIQAYHQPTNAGVQVAAEMPRAGAIITPTLILLTPSQSWGMGSVQGQVFRSDGATPAANVAIYTSRGGYTMTSESGAYRFDNLPEGPVSLRALDQIALEQADVRTTVVASTSVTANLVLFGGRGSVRGAVFEENGTPAADISIFGGPALVKTDANGQFVLEDIPVGQRQISALDQTRNRIVQKTVTIAGPGDEAIVQMTLPARGVISGRVLRADGVTPVANVRVIAFGPGTFKVFTNAQGEYTIENADMGEYTVAAFLDDFSDGNIALGKLVYNNQVQRIDVVFKGRGKEISGVILDDDGQTPIGAAVGLSELRIKFGKLTPPENPLCLGAIDLGGGESLTLPPCETVPVGFEYVRRIRKMNSDPATGRYKFDTPFVGPVMVEAANPFSPQEVGLNTEVPAPGATVNITLSLQSTGVVTGTVFRPDGSPVGENVIVRFDSSYLSDVAVRTDPQGNFLFPLINPGGFTLSASDPISGLVGQSVGSVKVGQTTYMPIHLLREGSVTVLVIGEDDLPIAGADVTLNEGHFPRRQRTGQTNASGQITFAGGDSVSEGSFGVRAYDRNRGVWGSSQGNMPSLSVSPGGQVSVTVKIRNSAATVNGYFIRGSGVGIPNAQVVMSGAAGTLYATTEGDGYFQFDGVLAGSFQLRAEDPVTFRRGFATGMVATNNITVAVTLVEQALGVVTGVVRRQPENTPIAGGQVRLSFGGPFPGNRYTTTGPDGAYTFPGAPAGSFTVFVTDPQDVNRSAQASGNLTTEGQIVTADINIQRPLVGRVEGQVYNANGSPSTTAMVTLSPGNLQTTVDNNGHYMFLNVPLGAVQVIARPLMGQAAGGNTGSVAFDGDVETLDITILGVGAVLGQVTNAADQPVGLAEVTLARKPDGAPVSYNEVTQADAGGRFTFTNVVVGELSATGRQAGVNLSGVASGLLANNGDTLTMTVKLEASGTVSGTVARPDGSPASLMALELRRSGATYYGSTRPDGAFQFNNVKLGSYTLSIWDPLGQGIADASPTVSSQGQIVDLGVLTLDIAPPSVLAVSPANGANGVPVTARIVVTFSEPMQAATINGSNLVVTRNGANVAGGWSLDNTGSVATFTPSQNLVDLSNYSLRVKTGVKDLVNRMMAGEFVASFMTADTTPPAIASRSPNSGAYNVALNTPVRITFSEAVNPAAMENPALTITQNGQPVSGTVTFILNNTVVVFTPLTPWSANSLVQVNIAPAPDVFGNILAGSTYSFETLDVIAPPLPILDAPGGATVLAGDTAHIVATINAAPDTDFVEFFVDGVSRLIDNSAPYEFNYSVPQGAPGGSITIAGRAVDRVGNSSQQQTLVLTVLSDAKPAANITSPLSGTLVASGGSVTVQVSASDDRGLAQIVFQATGGASGAGTLIVTPTVTTKVANFTFNVPAGATPGSRIELRASAIDTHGQASDVAASHLIVRDAVAPILSFSAPAPNTPVMPGATVSVTVHASDSGGVASLRLVGSNAAAFDETKTVSPTKTSTQITFGVPVHANARVTQQLVLVARAQDAVGNQSQPVTLTLPVRDVFGPSVQITVTSGSEVLPGKKITFTVAASDETAVKQLGYRITGPFTTGGMFVVNPVKASAARVFAVTAPVSVTAGSVISVTGVATDTLNNVGASTAHTVTVISDAPPTPTVVAIKGCQLDNGGCDLRVVAGAAFTVAVQANDDNGVKELRLRTVGALVSTQTRAFTPTLAVSALFTVTPPTAALHGQPITLTVEAVDTRNQLGVSPAQAVTVADLTPPTASIQSPGSWWVLTPGQSFTLQTWAGDNSSLASVQVTVTGALSATAGAQIAPGVKSIYHSFVFTVPVQATANDVITLSVQARDAAGNLSAVMTQRNNLADIHPPQVQIAVADGMTETLPLGMVAATVTATDEINVTQVQLRVSGAYTTTLNQWINWPYTQTATVMFNFQTPPHLAPGSILKLEGWGRDPSGNWGVSQVYTITVAQPEGTLSGAVTWFGSGAPVAHAAVEIQADNGFFTTTANAEGFYATVEPVVGWVEVIAYDPVSGARGVNANYVEPDGDAPVIDVVVSAKPIVTITAPLSGSVAIENDYLVLTAEASDDNGLEGFTLLVNGEPWDWQGAGDVHSTAEFQVYAPSGVTSMTLAVRAFDVDGNATNSAPVLVNIIPDPLTTVTGVVHDQANQPVAGAEVIIRSELGYFGYDDHLGSGVTGVDGRFTITGVTTIQGKLYAVAHGEIGGVVMVGKSAEITPARGGLTDVGGLTLAPGKVWDGGAGTNSWWDAANWSDNTLPQTGDDVYIPVTATVHLPGGSWDIRSLRSDGRLTLENSAYLFVFTNAVVRNDLTVKDASLETTAGVTVTGVLTLSNGGFYGANMAASQTPVAALGGLVIDGGTNFLSRVTLTNDGAGVWKGGNLAMSSGAVFENLPGATLEIRDATNAYHHFGLGLLPTFRNRGSVTKTTTDGQMSSFSVRVENSGALTVTSGLLSISSSFVHSGTLVVETGGQAEFINSPGAFAAGSSVTGGGFVRLRPAPVWGSPVEIAIAGLYAVSGETAIEGGLINVSAGATFTPARLRLVGGELRSTSAITVTDVMTWNATTLSGGGSVTALNNIIMDSASSRTLNGKTLVNRGHALWSGQINGTNGARWHNLPGATTELAGDANNFWWDNSPQPAVLNEGTLIKTAPATTAILRSVMTNTGVIDVAAGVLRLRNNSVTLPPGGTQGGSVTVQPGATLDLAGGNHTVAGGGSLTNNGSVTLSSGSLSVNVGGNLVNNGLLTFSAGSFTLNGGYSGAGDLRISGGAHSFDSGAGIVLPRLTLSFGTLQGGDPITVTNMMTWTGGTMTGGGRTTATGALKLGNGTMTLNGRSLALHGAGAWVGGDLWAQNGARLVVMAGATLDVTGDTLFDHFNNVGAAPTLQVDGSLTMNTVNKPFEVEGNLVIDGALTLTSGTAWFWGTTTHRGSLEVQAGATVDQRGTFNAEAGSTITGAGVFRNNSGSMTLAGSYTVGGLTDMAAGALTATPGALFTSAQLQLTGNASLQANSKITVTQVFTWVSGTLSGSGSTTTANLRMTSSTKNLNGHTLTVSGQAVHTGGVLRGANGAVVRIPPGAVFDVQTNSNMEFSPATGTRPALQVEGLLIKSAGTENTMDWTVNNLGEVRAANGVMTLRGGGLGSNLFTADANGTLKFAADYAIAASATVQGAGVFMYTGGTVTVEGVYSLDGVTWIDNGTLSFEPASILFKLGDKVHFARGGLNLRSGEPAILNKLELGNGAPTLTADDPITVTNMMTWTSGALKGLGRMALLGSTLMQSTSNKFIEDFRLENYGNAVWSGGAFFINKNTVFTNHAGATFDIRTNADVSVNVAPVGSFINHGAVLKTTVGDVTTIPALFDNSGLLDVAMGAVQLTGGGVSIGQINVQAGATLEVASKPYNVAAGGAVQGAGNVRALNPFTVEGTYNLAGTTESGSSGKITLSPTATLVSLGGLVNLTNGELTLNSGEQVAVSRLQMTNGTLSGSDSLTVTNAFTWTSGALKGSGRLFSGGSAVLDGSTKTVDGRTLENGGSALWNSGDISLINGGVFRNRAGATFDARTGNSFSQAAGTIINEGVLVKSAGASDQSFFGSVTNSGTLRVQTGGIHFRTSFVQTGGMTWLDGGSLRMTSPAAIQIQGGALTGRGSINSHVVNAGALKMDPLGSALTINGNYTQQAGGSMVVGVQSLDPTTGFDRLAVSGQATLSGGLVITRPTGFEPNLGDSLTIMTFASRTGTFTTVDGRAIGNGKRFDVIHNAMNVQLSVAPDTLGAGVELPTQPLTTTVPGEPAAVITPAVGAPAVETATPTVTVPTEATPTQPATNALPEGASVRVFLPVIQRDSVLVIGQSENTPAPVDAPAPGDEGAPEAGEQNQRLYLPAIFNGGGVSVVAE